LPIAAEGDIMKKALTTILVVILALLPTIVAAVLHLTPDEIIQTPINLSGSLIDENGNGYEFNRNNNSFLASFFDDLDDNSIKSSYSLDNIKYDKKFIAEIVKKDKKQKLDFYLSILGSCYYSDESGTLYRIDTSYANALINSKYVVSLYEERYTPALLSFSKQPILPESVDLKYSSKSGNEPLSAQNLPTSNTPITYYSSQVSTFDFSVTPELCTLRVYINDRKYYDGQLYDFKSSIIPKHATTVKYEIDATWMQTTSNKCFGDAHYSFYISYAPAPAFTVNNVDNEFLTVRAQNVIDPANITCSLSDGKPVDVSFHRSGDDYFALIPTASLLAPGKHKLILSCGETDKAVEVEVPQQDSSVSSKVYTPKSPITAQMLEDMTALLSKIGAQSSNDSPAGGAFINIETRYADDFSLTLGYGKVRSFTEGESLNMIGVEFSGLADMDIPAINDGIVCAVGEDAILGKYVVIDHGYGLKSWYCNISEPSVAVGTHINGGSAVAKSGNSAIYDQNGFYLITTIGKTPVSPYAVYENNFTLPQ